MDKKKWHQLWQVRELSNGNIVFIGQAVYQGNIDHAGWIGKLDIDGNLLWERFHVNKDEPFFRRKAVFSGDFQQTKDNGFTITGMVWRQQDTTQPSVFTTHIWLVKLDSMGCFEGDCGILVGVEDVKDKNQEARVVVYPNPFTYSALISIRANQHPGEEIVFQLADITGRVLFTKKHSLNSLGYGEFTFKKGTLPAGIYPFTTSNNGIVLGTGKMVIQ